ncbi:WD repeat-containing protein 74 [Haplosporangium sp. Z 767]|nr:WD repeat-containing protein 74 [Haplosporangium sp. Z 11]KAF9193384.1 WD repeat-containing protein 74 [Haplosporangium sp. Z 767]
MSSRRFYTGDEQGLVKVVTITEPLVVKVKRVRRNQPTPEAPAKPVPTVETWGVPDRTKAIQLLCWDHEKKHLVVARKNGLVQLMDPKDGAVVSEFQYTLGKDNKVDNFFVGLFANAESIITCTNTGALTVQSIQNRTESTVMNVGKDICRMRVHPKEHHIIATAGKEQELTIWDLNVLCKDPSEDAEPQAETKKGKKTGKNGTAASINESSSTTAGSGKKANKVSGPEARYKSKEVLARGQLFKAKNVKNDHLDLRVPVWNTELQFLSQFDYSRIAVGTRFHQIRVYDTKNGARRPAVDAEVGEMPVVAMANGKDAGEVVFSDTVTNVYSVDTLTGQILGQYKGFTGVATALETFTPFEDDETTHLVSVAMDRCLRVHEMNKTRKLLHKVYLKQRMTAVVVGEYTPAEPTEDDEEGGSSRSKKNAGNDDDENDDDLWESMGKLEDKKSKKRKINKE